MKKQDKEIAVQSELMRKYNYAYSKELQAFADLIRADERNRTWTQEHWTEYENSIAAAEREAIIDLVAMYGGTVDLEAAIRARGEQA